MMKMSLSGSKLIKRSMRMGLDSTCMLKVISLRREEDKRLWSMREPLEAILWKRMRRMRTALNVNFDQIRA